MIKNALHVPSMQHNLIPPFILREVGLIVNDVPKIHIDNPVKADHSIYFPKDKIRIALLLRGIFFGFVSSKPSE